MFHRASGKSGLSTSALIVALQRLVEPAGGLQCVAELVVRLRIVRPLRDGCRVTGNGFIGAAIGEQCVAEIVVCLRKHRSQCECLPIAGHRLVRQAGELELCAEVVVCLGVVGFRVSTR